MFGTEDVILSCNIFWHVFLKIMIFYLVAKSQFWEKLVWFGRNNYWFSLFGGQYSNQWLGLLGKRSLVDPSVRPAIANWKGHRDFPKSKPNIFELFKIWKLSFDTSHRLYRADQVGFLGTVSNNSFEKIRFCPTKTFRSPRCAKINLYSIFWNGFYTNQTQKIPTESVDVAKLSGKPEI